MDSDAQIPNQMIKYLKFGFGYATDEICYDIREGRFSREAGKWVRRFTVGEDYDSDLED